MSENRPPIGGDREREYERPTRCEFCAAIFDVEGRASEERRDGPRYECPNCMEYTYGPVAEYLD